MSLDLSWEREKSHRNPTRDSESKLGSTAQDVGMRDIGDVPKPTGSPSQRNRGKEFTPVIEVTKVSKSKYLVQFWVLISTESEGALKSPN